MLIDDLGTRIKTKYEDPFRFKLSQRTFVIIRIDGKAFHTFTRKLPKPYSTRLAEAMDVAALSLSKTMMGCRFAYGQSDEYSFLITDFETPKTQMWFDGNIQKIASVSASTFTASFNHAWSAGMEPGEKLKFGTFDARVFSIAGRSDVKAYFQWRQIDAERNSLNMFASCHFSHKQLHEKGSSAKHEMLHDLGLNWNDCEIPFKRGRVIRKITSQRNVTFTHKKTKEVNSIVVDEPVWSVDSKIPVFLREEGYLEDLIPKFQD